MLVVEEEQKEKEDAEVEEKATLISLFLLLCSIFVSSFFFHSVFLLKKKQRKQNCIFTSYRALRLVKFVFLLKMFDDGDDDMVRLPSRCLFLKRKCTNDKQKKAVRRENAKFSFSLVALFHALDAEKKNSIKPPSFFFQTRKNTNRISTLWQLWRSRPSQLEAETA